MSAAGRAKVVSGFVTTTCLEAVLLRQTMLPSLRHPEYDEKLLFSLLFLRNRIVEEKLQNLFDAIDDVCAELDQAHLEGDLDHIPAAEIQYYWSKYNLRKRLLRSLYQTNKRILEFLAPEVFENHQEFRKKCLADLEKKPDDQKKCLQCGCVLEEWELQLCEGCEETYE